MLGLIVPMVLSAIVRMVRRLGWGRAVTMVVVLMDLFLRMEMEAAGVAKTDV